MLCHVLWYIDIDVEFIERYRLAETNTTLSIAQCETQSVQETLGYWVCWLGGEVGVSGNNI